MKWLLPLLCLTLCLPTLHAQNADKPTKQKKAKKAPAPFAWVNPMPEGKWPFLQHRTFKSPSMNADVGYCIYLPSAYKKKDAGERRFPVVYLLHGGRPGSELKMGNVIKYVHEAMEAGKVRPMIYVLPNGGRVSHYNMPDSKGEDVFVKELIPHIDKTFRTIASRGGRAIEGFSQGGRGTARIMFKYPELFASAAPGGGGYATEKKVSESGGYENEKLFFGKGVNTWDRARVYAKAKAAAQAPDLNILVYVGDKGFNYQNNMEYTAFLKSIGIEHRRLVVPDAPHSASVIYEKKGIEIMRFHAGNLAR